MKLTVSILFLAHSALSLSLYGSGLDERYKSSATARSGHIYRRQDPPVNIPANFTDPEAEAMYEAVCKTATSATVAQAVVADINNVTTNALAVEAEFRNVAAQLAFIDSQHLDNQTFSANWTILHQQWTDTLWASRDTATDTIVYCDEFITTIMQFVTNITIPNGVPPPVAIEVLQEYISEADDFKTRAQAQVTAFTTLQTDLAIFAASFGNFAKKLQASDVAEISSLLEDISALNATINKLDHEISQVAEALEITVIATLGASILFPLAAPLILTAGVLAAGAEGTAWAILANERSSAAHDLAEDQATITTLQLQESAIAQANSTLHTIQNTTVPTMIGQLDAFNVFWNAVISDCQSGIDYFNSAEKKTIPLLFWSTIEGVPCIYDQLVPSLNNYAVGIDTSSIPPPTNAKVAPVSAVKTYSKDAFSAKVQSIINKATLKAAVMMSGGKAS